MPGSSVGQSSRLVSGRSGVKSPRPHGEVTRCAHSARNDVGQRDAGAAARQRIVGTATFASPGLVPSLTATTAMNNRRADHQAPATRLPGVRRAGRPTGMRRGGSVGLRRVSPVIELLGEALFACPGPAYHEAQRGGNAEKLVSGRSPTTARGPTPRRHTAPAEELDRQAVGRGSAASEKIRSPVKRHTMMAEANPSIWSSPKPTSAIEPASTPARIRRHPRQPCSRGSPRTAAAPSTPGVSALRGGSPRRWRSSHDPSVAGVHHPKLAQCLPATRERAPRHCRPPRDHPVPGVPGRVSVGRRATATPAFHPGARPRSGRLTASTSSPPRTISHATTEFEFHMSPVWSSSRPQTGVAPSRASRGSSGVVAVDRKDDIGDHASRPPEL